MPPSILMVQTTLASEQSAHDLALTLVTERLAACAHLLPIASIYRWKGEIARDTEWLVIVKTREDLYDRLAARMRELHSYEVPEIVAVPIACGLPAYLEWIDAATAHDERRAR